MVEGGEWAVNHKLRGRHVWGPQRSGRQRSCCPNDPSPLLCLLPISLGLASAAYSAESRSRSLFERGVKRGGLLLRHMFYRSLACPTLGIEREGEKAATVTTPTDRADRALFPFLLYPTFGLSSFPPFVFARIVRREVERGRKWGIFPLSGLMFFILFF